MPDLFPSFESFTACYSSGKSQLVWTRQINDLETPITASLKLQETGKPFFLLESVQGGESRGRYSIIGLDPDRVWTCEKGAVSITENGKATPDSRDPLDSFRAFFKEAQFETPSELPPSAFGIIGYMGYDSIRFVEPSLPDENPDKLEIPTGIFMRPTSMLTFDAVMQTLTVVTPVFPSEEVSAEEAFKKASDRIDSLLNKLEAQLPISRRVQAVPELDLEFTPNMSKEEFEAMVDRAKEYILAGDIFQVVPSQRFQTPFPWSPFAFYRSLRHLNPSPFLFFLDLGNFQLIGSSPEIMVRLRDNKVTIRPLAGTRKRGKTLQEDLELEADLLADEKEIAEHLMLVDLSRNDVGRVSLPGSVKVTERFIVEKYSHVMHISSNVEGDLDPQFDALDALFAGLPVGTVSGAPKIRAMEIIDELENEKRSFYAGCVGYLSANGSMDTCITLRTALIKNNVMTLQAGCGVVADSVPESEYQETINKVKALMIAAEQTSFFL